jgi:hypothetical protein
MSRRVTCKPATEPGESAGRWPADSFPEYELVISVDLTSFGAELA